MHTWPDFISPADLAPGDATAATIDWAPLDLRLHTVTGPDDPYFEIGYQLLRAQFEPSGEIETRGVLVDRLGWTPSHPINDCAMLYEMVLIFSGTTCAAVRDHTAIYHRDSAEIIVHLSHILINPEFRGKGLAPLLRALPAKTARACATAIGQPDLPITLFAEMDLYNPDLPASIARCRSYERAGFLKVDPSIGYLQPDFRATPDIDASGGPCTIPLDVLILRHGRTQKDRLPAAELHAIIRSIHEMYAASLRPSEMQPCQKWFTQLATTPVTDYALIRPTELVSADVKEKFPVFYHPGFATPIGDSHIMPIQKFALVAEQLRHRPAANFIHPPPITREALARVHTAAYIRAIETGEPRALAESQKFPWSPTLFPSVLLTSGGITAAARHALTTRSPAACLASGFHHASADHGEGFCTFNGLIIALETLRHEGLIQRAAILDMDLHYGNGTASLIATRPWITGVSIYGNDYWENTAYPDVETRRHPPVPGHHSVPVPNAADGPRYLAILEKSLPLLLTPSRPDILLYQAGADPYHEDPYSPLHLTHADLKARDLRVFSFCRDYKIPVAWVLAGGYTKDISKVVQVHINTFDACAEIYLNLKSSERDGFPDKTSRLKNRGVSPEATVLHRVPCSDQ